MSQELIYTSAPKGLKQGSRGFCTVACTPGMAKNLADLLESISGYKHLFAPEGPDAPRNPVNHAFLRYKLGGVEYLFLSRVADCGLDYTQRSNKIAHHFVLGREELLPAGPASTMQQASLFVKDWEDAPRILTPRRPLEPDPREATPCLAWKALTGDAGWGGEFVASVAGDTLRKAYLIYKPGTDVLALFAESMALLPETRRWSVSFSTYFTAVPPGVDCHWRGLVDGTSEAERARHLRDALVIDLTNLSGQPRESEFVEMARTGRALTPEPVVQEQAYSAPEATSPEPAMHRNSSEVLETPREVSSQPTLPTQLPPKLPQLAVAGGDPPSRIAYQEDIAPPRNNRLILAAVFGIVSMIGGIGIGALFFGSPSNSPGSDSIAQANGEPSDTTNTEIDRPDFSSKKDRNTAMPLPEEPLEDLSIPDAISDKMPEFEDALADANKPESIFSASALEEDTNSYPLGPEIDFKPSETNDQLSQRDQSPPLGLFDDLADSISLPEKHLSGSEDENFALVSIGELNPARFNVGLQLMQSRSDLKVERVPDSPHHWKITTELRGRPIELAIVRCASGEAIIRWGKDSSATAENALRASFLVFTERTTGQKKTIALELPQIRKSQLRFSPDLKEVRVGVEKVLGGPNCSIPKGQSFSATGNVIALPFIDADLESSFHDYQFQISEDSEKMEWFQDIVHGGGLRLLVQIERETHPYLRAEIQCIEDSGRNNFTAFTTKQFRKLVKKRRIILEEEIKKHLKFFWNRGLSILNEGLKGRSANIEFSLKNEMDRNVRQRIREDLNAPYEKPNPKKFRAVVWEVFSTTNPVLKEHSSKIERLSNLELFEEWLRTEEWKLRRKDWDSLSNDRRIHELDIRHYFFSEGSIQISDRLEKEQKRRPIERLLAWEKGVDGIQKTEIHFRLSRSLAPSDAPGIDPPPRADVLVVGSPTEPMNH